MKSVNLSHVLVSLQFLFIALIASPIHVFMSTKPLAIIGLLLIGVSAALALWALVSMRKGTFRVMPEPSKNAQLTQSGPYQFVRHPMYSAVLLAALGSAISHASLFHTGLFLALICVLLFKIKREESALTARFDNYDRYKTHSKALIPFVY